MAKKLRTRTQLLYRDAFLCLCMSLFFMFILSFLVVNLSIFDPFTKAFKDFSFLDLYHSEKMAALKPTNEIILVNIEQADRFQIQELLSHIQNQQPKAIGLDVIFKEEKDPFVDSLLQIQLTRPNVITAKAFVANSWHYDFSNRDKDIQKTGYTNLNFNSTENVIREFQGYYSINDTLHASLAATTASYYLGKSWPEKKIRKKLENESTIDFVGNMDSFINFSFDECMNMETIPAMKDKIVLLGYLGKPHGSNTDIEDKFYTPLNSVSAGKSAPDMFGVVIHANIIQMMLTDTYFTAAPNWLITICALLLAYFGLVFFLWYNLKYSASYGIVLKIAQLSLTVLLLWFSLWLYKNKVIFAPELVTVFLVISVEFIDLFELITEKLNTKYKWKSFYFYD